jgi:hypothetical protein
LTKLVLDGYVNYAVTISGFANEFTWRCGKLMEEPSWDESMDEEAWYMYDPRTLANEAVRMEEASLDMLWNQRAEWDREFPYDGTQSVNPFDPTEGVDGKGAPSKRSLLEASSESLVL